MENDEEKVDDTVLALLYLLPLRISHDGGHGRVRVGMSSIDCIRKDTFRIQPRRQNLCC
jgi:hypothetical protein